MQREKQTRSGRLFEVDFYPVFADGRRMPTRAPKTKRSTAEQARYNRKKAVKNFVRKVNANFVTGDLYTHPTYEPGCAPFTIEDAKRDIVNFFRRVKTARAATLKSVVKELAERPDNKKLLSERKKLEEPFKYAYRIEVETFKRGARTGQERYHFHLFMTGGLDRDAVEALWPYGERINVDKYRPEVFGPEAAALYTTKSGQGKLKLGFSKNLTAPDESKVKDGQISAKGVTKMATERVDDAAYWERRYKGYKFLRCYSRFNDYNGYWYVSVVMYKPEGTGPLPEWNNDVDWMTEAE